MARTRGGRSSGKLRSSGVSVRLVRLDETYTEAGDEFLSANVVEGHIEDGSSSESSDDTVTFKPDSDDASGSEGRKGDSDSESSVSEEEEDEEELEGESSDEGEIGEDEESETNPLAKSTAKRAVKSSKHKGKAPLVRGAKTSRTSMKRPAAKKSKPKSDEDSDEEPESKHKGKAPLVRGGKTSKTSMKRPVAKKAKPNSDEESEEEPEVELAKKRRMSASKGKGKGALVRGSRHSAKKPLALGTRARGDTTGSLKKTDKTGKLKKTEEAGSSKKKDKSSLGKRLGGPRKKRVKRPRLQKTYPYVCPRCTQAYRTPHHLRSHLIECAGRCPRCSDWCERRHIPDCDGSRPKNARVLCQFCKRLFVAINIARHCRYKHGIDDFSLADYPEFISEAEYWRRYDAGLIGAPTSSGQPDVSENSNLPGGSRGLTTRAMKTAQDKAGAVGRGSNPEAGVCRRMHVDDEEHQRLKQRITKRALEKALEKAGAAGRGMDPEVGVCGRMHVDDAEHKRLKEGLHDVEVQWQRHREVCDLHTRQSEELVASLGQRLEERIDEIAVLEFRNEESRNEMDSLRRRITELENQQDVSIRSSEAEALRKEVTALERALADANRAKDEAELTVSEEKEKHEGQVELWDGMLAGLRTTVTQLEGQLEAKDAELKACQAVVRANIEEVQSTELQSNRLRQAVASLTLELTGVRGELQRLQERNQDRLDAEEAGPSRQIGVETPEVVSEGTGGIDTLGDDHTEEYRKPEEQDPSVELFRELEDEATAGRSVMSASQDVVCTPDLLPFGSEVDDHFLSENEDEMNIAAEEARLSADNQFWFVIPNNFLSNKKYIPSKRMYDRIGEIPRPIIRALLTAFAPDIPPDPVNAFVALKEGRLPAWVVIYFIRCQHYLDSPLACKFFRALYLLEWVRASIVGVEPGFLPSSGVPRRQSDAAQNEEVGSDADSEPGGPKRRRLGEGQD